MLTPKREWKPWRYIAIPAVLGLLLIGKLIADENIGDGTPTTPYAADVINGTPYQRIKLTWGANNTCTDASAAAPLPVTVISGGGGTTYTEDVASAGAESLMLMGVVRRDTAASSSTTDGDYSTLNTDSTGRLWTNADITKVGGTATDTNSGTKSAGTLRVVLATDQPALTNSLLTVNQATTTGGYTQHHIVSANSNNATNLKNGAGMVYSIQVFNLNAAARYLKFYDKASSPSPGSDTVVKSILIPGNTAGAGVALSWPAGVVFGTGISYALVTGVGDTDNTSVAASEIVLNIDYK